MDTCQTAAARRIKYEQGINGFGQAWNGGFCGADKWCIADAEKQSWTKCGSLGRSESNSDVLMAGILFCVSEEDY